MSNTMYANEGRRCSVLHSALCTLRSAFPRFIRDERGQGIIFAAASLMVLIGFVALVYNLGRVIERRTQMQIAADSAAYSGAMVQANALSSIAWMNSAMAQTEYNAMKYAVDVNVTAVSALMELIQSGGVTGTKCVWHQQKWANANVGLPQAKTLMVQLSQTENAVAILTPRLLSEEMFATATRAGGERMSVFPSQRMYPAGEQPPVSYRIEQFGNGWRITNLTGGNGEMLQVLLVGSDEWRIDYSLEGITETEVVIKQESSNKWKVSFYDHGALTQEIYLVRTDDLGWVVWGRTIDASGDSTDLPQVTFDPVDMDGDGTNEGTRVTCNGVAQVFKRGPEGDLYVWNNEASDYFNMTNSTTTIAGVEIRVNVTNVINFPGGASATIGEPTQVHIGRAHITLSEPPVIGTGLGPVWISIRGFDPDSFGVSVGSFSLTSGDADGRWRKWFDPIEELWSRQRLTEQTPEFGALKQWQYDHETLGALLTQEMNIWRRYFVLHAFGDRGFTENNLPEWTAWFDPVTGMARQPNWRHTYPRPLALEIINPNNQNPPPEDVYCQTQLCATCNGIGVEDVLDDPNNPLGGTHQIRCRVCHGIDHDLDGQTDIRVFLSDIPNGRVFGWFPRDPVLYTQLLCNGSPGLQDNDYLDNRVHKVGSYATAGAPSSPARYPLVLAAEFFKFGVNIGAWKASDTPMLFPASYQPAWGYVALASARAGIPDPTASDGIRYQFPEGPAERDDWVENNSANLYLADVRARLTSSRDQVYDYDLDPLPGSPVAESGLSYLWDALLGTGYPYPYEYNGWLDQFDGRSDPRVGAALRNMTNRQGDRLDFGDPGMGEVVEH